MTDRTQSALLLVDIQPDFLPGGALAVEEGHQILPLVRKLMESDRFGLQVATQDWHPPGHVSFASSHAGHQPLETIELHGQPQTLWPDHCVQGTLGAKLHPDLPWTRIAALIRKGMDPQSDSYSGFRNNWNPAGERPSTGLAGYLRERGISDLYVCGLARDVCVLWTAEDGAEAGFKVHFLWDATRPVDPAANANIEQALTQQGIEIMTVDSLGITAR